MSRLWVGIRKVKTHRIRLRTNPITIKPDKSQTLQHMPIWWESVVSNNRHLFQERKRSFDLFFYLLDSNTNSLDFTVIVNRKTQWRFG